MPTVSGGVGAFVYSLTPALPAGVTFTAGTRAITGTPTAAVASATYTFTATDTEGIAASRTFTTGCCCVGGNYIYLYAEDTRHVDTFTIVVTATAITFASAITNQSWIVGTAVNLTLPTASGGVGSFTYSLSTGLPSGVTFTAGTRSLAGNPTATLSSTTFTYTATDSEGITQTTTFTIVVTTAAVALGFGTSTIANQAWLVGTAVSVSLPAATGGTGDKTYTLSPTLPAGATFTASTRVLVRVHPISDFHISDFYLYGRG